MSIFLKKVRKALWVLALFIFASPAMAAVNTGIDEANSVAGLPPGKGSTAAESIAMGVGDILGAVLAFLGVMFLALMIYGGILWMTVPANEKGVRKSKTIISAAVIGLIIVLSAYAITAYLGDVLAK